VHRRAGGNKGELCKRTEPESSRLGGETDGAGRRSGGVNSPPMTGKAEPCDVKRGWTGAGVGCFINYQSQRNITTGCRVKRVEQGL